MFSAPSPKTEPLKGKRILLVEDDVTLLRLLTAFLQDQGHFVTGTDNALDALGALDAECWDLIVTDGALKSSCGQEFAAQVAANRSNIPLLLITGSIREVEDPTLFQGVLRKPFSRTEFIRFVNEGLGLPPAATATESVTRRREKAA